MNNQNQECHKETMNTAICGYCILTIKEYLSTILTIITIYCFIGGIICLIKIFSELNLLNAMYIVSTLTMMYLGACIANIYKYLANSIQVIRGLYNFNFNNKDWKCINELYEAILIVIGGKEDDE